MPGQAPSRNDAPSPTGTTIGRRARLQGLCLLLGLLAAIVVLWFFGVTLWTLGAIALFIACPLVVGWILLAERREPGGRGTGP